MTKEHWSGPLSWLTGTALLERVIRFGKQLGAPSEETFDFDGGLSYHAEAHAVGLGFGIGLIAMTTGQTQLLATIFSTTVAGNRGESPFSGKLLEDVMSEKHYFIGALAFGLVAGKII